MVTKRKKDDSQLDTYEQEIEDNLGKTTLTEKEKKRSLSALQQAADNYTKKSSRISIRVYGSDLRQLKMIAAREGLPYQTLITSILHKYATGQYKEL